MPSPKGVAGRLLLAKGRLEESPWPSSPFAFAPQQRTAPSSSTCQQDLRHRKHLHMPPEFQISDR